MSQSEAINEIAAALAKAQGQFKNPIKNCTVKVRTKSGNEYQFKYADLTAVIDAIQKPLADNGIARIQYVEEVDGRNRLITLLIHGNSGQWIKSTYPLFVGEQGSQPFGSAQTFMKRYALCAMLGVSADTDDDANLAEGNRVEFTNGQTAAKKYGTTPEDVVEHDIELDSDGNPVDNIPVGQEGIKPMSKAMGRPEYAKLLADIKSFFDLEQLTKWGHTNANRVATLPADWQIHLRDEFRSKQIELGWKPKA